MWDSRENIARISVGGGKIRSSVKIRKITIDFISFVVLREKKVLGPILEKFSCC